MTETSIAMIAMLVPLGFFTMIAFVVWFGLRTRQQAAALHAETLQKLFDKLAPTQESIAFLASEPGKRLLEAVATPRGSANPYSRILKALSAGVILSTFGLGLLVFYGMASEQDDKVIGFGVLAVAVGVGFLLAAGLSFRLSQSWGLLEDQPSDTAAPAKLTP